MIAPFVRRLVDYERMRPSRRLWDLAGIRALLAATGPAATRPAVQVAGSKGKGTTAAFLAGLARAAGLRVGVYSSPHVESVCERIVIDGQPIHPVRLRDRVADLVQTGDELGLSLTFFEVMTAAAVGEFAAAQLDLAIYEVGLGGRFDATTAIEVDASIVTGIELEHTELLGNTVAAIAREKASVIRPDGLGFTAARGEALAVISAHALEVGAQLHSLGDDLRFTEPCWSGADYRARLCLPTGEQVAVYLPDARAFELPALALAAAALKAVAPAVPLRTDPVPRPQLPGRFEVLVGPGGAPLVLDGAHTSESMAAVVTELERRWPGRRVTAMFACAQGKRWRSGLSRLFPIADSIVVTELPGTVGEDPAVVADWLRARGRVGTVVDDVAAGLAALLARPGPHLVIGSFYLIGRVRSLLQLDQDS